MDEESAPGVEGDVEGLEGAGDGGVALASVGGVVAGNDDAFGACFAGESGDFLDGVAEADVEAGAALAEGGIEFVECGEEEGRSVGRCPVAVEEVWVDDVEGCDGPGFEGGGEGRVVVEAEVAAEPEDGGHRSDCARRGRSAAVMVPACWLRR